MKYLFMMALFCATLLANDLGWSHDYKEAVEKSKISKKLIYTLITSDDCRWCRKFEETTLTNKDILKRLYAEFEVVQISRDQHKVPLGFASSPVPRHYFTDSEGKILYSSLGHRDLECFFSFMDNAQEKQKVTK